MFASVFSVIVLTTIVALVAISATRDHHRSQICTAATSSIDEHGRETTVWYPRGCVHKESK